MNHELKHKINKANIVSFDIFDTLLIRNVLHPTDIFKFVHKQYEFQNNNFLNIDFEQERIKAERQARTYQESQEVNLKEIYEELKNATKLSDEIIEKLKQLEIQAELDFCTCNKYMLDIYNYCLKKSKKIIIMTDMYLPIELIKALLKQSGYKDFSKIYLSSECRKSKWSGSLYKFMLDDLKVNAKNILHIGDNERSDIKNADNNGLDTYYYQKSSDFAKANSLNHEIIKPLKDDISIESSVFQALVINKFCTDRSGTLNNSFWYSFGYKKVGILFYGYIEWLINSLKESSIEKAFFFSRDGWIMNEIYKIMSPYFDNDIKSEYLMASRRAYNIAQLKHNQTDNYEFLKQFFSFGTRSSKLTTRIQLMGLDPKNYIKEAKEAGYSSINVNVDVTKEIDVAKLSNFFDLISKNIIDNAQKEQKALTEYFQKKGVYDHKNIGIVDIGWYGSIQYSFEKIIKDADISVNGFYLATFDGKDFCQKIRRKGFLFNDNKPSETFNLVRSALEIFEMLHLTSSGSFVRLEESGNHVYDNDVDIQRYKKIEIMQNAAIEFIKDLIAIKEKYKFLEISKELSLKPMERLILSPTYDEAVNIGNLKHVDGSVEDFYYIAKPPGLLRSLFYHKNYLKKYLNPYWFNGYNKRLEKTVVLKNIKRNHQLDGISQIARNKKIHKKLDILMKNNMDKVVCFYGAGIFLQEFLKYYNSKKINITAIIDKDKSKLGQKIKGIEIFTPEYIKTINPDIMILSVQNPMPIIPFLEEYKKKENLEFELVDNLFTVN